VRHAARRIAFSLLIVVGAASHGAASDDVRAVRRAVPLLQRSAAAFVEKRACFSCHHNGLSIMTLRQAERRGITVNQDVLTAVEAKTFGVLSDNAVDAAVQGSSLSDPTPNDSLLLMAAHDAAIPDTLATGVLARRLTHWQRADGRWMTSDFRPPHSSSEFAATATAAAAIRAYLPSALSAERDAALGRAAAWLAASWPRSTEDAAYRLMGLVWSGAPRDTIEAASHILVSMQLPGGGWPQLAGYAADAYSTGESLYALRLGGMDASAHEWQRGRRFLIDSQAADGSWHVRSRMISPAEVSPPYFHTGFPYRKDEFLSYAGSCWAVMALLSGMPVPAAGVGPGTPPQGAGAPASPRGPAAVAEATAVGDKARAPEDWLRIALFGTASELAAALDAGLDPDAKTVGGTTVLMAAVLDADKTRLLLSRGADPRLRGSSRVDALTIAAGYVGTTESVAALLDAGAAIEPPDDTRVRRTPIAAAALAGDLRIVELLVRRGAKPSAEAISEALTFGHTEVVRVLIAAGGDVSGVDATGINLLHWAVITNRPAMIPILVKAGVPINAIDDVGFTPLMYAATVDHGDVAAIEALLAAGATASIRNDEGRTALEQARHLKHAEIVRVLQRK
jgi:ankyrin repeat protein